MRGGFGRGGWAGVDVERACKDAGAAAAAARGGEQALRRDLPDPGPGQRLTTMGAAVLMAGRVRGLGAGRVGGGHAAGVRRRLRCADQEAWRAWRAGEESGGKVSSCGQGGGGRGGPLGALQALRPRSRAAGQPVQRQLGPGGGPTFEGQGAEQQPQMLRLGPARAAAGGPSRLGDTAQSPGGRRRGAGSPGVPAPALTQRGAMSRGRRLALSRRPDDQLGPASGGAAACKALQGRIPATRTLEPRWGACRRPGGAQTGVWGTRGANVAE